MVSSDKSRSRYQEQRLLQDNKAGKSVVSRKTLDSITVEKKLESDNCNNVTNGKVKRSLLFHDTTSILWIERTEDLSNEEIDACFYNGRDYSRFRDRERRISRKFSTWGLVKGGRKGDYLGVETRLQRFHRRERSKNAVFAVILEQELREENRRRIDLHPEENDVVIARVYQQYTRESARLARERANLNASQVERKTSSLSDTGRLLDAEEETEAITTRFSLPWKVPGFNKNKTAKNRTENIIRYTTCTRPVLPQDYLEMSYREDQDTSWDQPQEVPDIRFEHQMEYEDRGTKNGSTRQEAPVQQHIIRTQEDEYSSQLTSSPHDAKAEQSLPGVITQPWMWNPMQCDVAKPTNVPNLLPWNLY
mmetsp:Transcript_78550/g.159490  ORF Transcript_78550/g.159490 Transcript_78550/m.159490 type:complete len:364 (+) Transcript_78550:1-1092(+)